MREYRTIIKLSCDPDSGTYKHIPKYFFMGVTGTAQGTVGSLRHVLGVAVGNIYGCNVWRICVAGVTPGATAPPHVHAL